ncbi:hypothetical protein ACLOJK_007319 [Asimina triloba]
MQRNSHPAGTCRRLILLITHPLSLIRFVTSSLPYLPHRLAREAPHRPNLQTPHPSHRPIHLSSRLPLHSLSCIFLSLSHLDSLSITSSAPPQSLFLFHFRLENQLKAPSLIQVF